METTFKKHKLVMLPTKYKTDLYLNLPISNLEFITDHINFNIKKAGNFQELYLLSDEEIKVGDWCINKNLDTLYQMDSSDIEKDKNLRWNKIIATTDKSLKLPEFKVDFISKFIYEYNKGNSINEVEVEYEWEDGDGIPGVGNCYNLKTNKNNEINICIPKDLYTRQEVEVLIDKAYKIGTDKYGIPMTIEELKNNF